MSTLITGAAGFIGFHAALKIKKVIGLDNFNAYYDVSLKRARAQKLKESGLEILEGDICNQELLQEIVQKYDVKTILHLAAQAGVRYSLINPKSYIQANVEGFLAVLETVRAHPEIKLIYASSSSVYGLNEKIPFSVEDRTDSQASLYGVTKKTNELMSATYHHLYNLDLVGLRFFTVYGPWGRPDMAYFSFTKAINEGRPIELYNYGNCERDFTYVDDIVRGIEACFDLPRGNFLFNLGNNQPVKLTYFVEILEKELGKKATKKLLALQAGDVVRTFADIDESANRLGFKPQVSLEEGLGRFVSWYKEFYSKKL